MPKKKGRTELEKLRHYAEIEQMDRRGYTQYEMALALGLSAAQVGNDLRKIKERYEATILDSRAVYIAEKLQQYREVRRQAWQAWEESRRPLRKVQEERTLNFDPFLFPNGEADDDAAGDAPRIPNRPSQNSRSGSTRIPDDPDSSTGRDVPSAAGNEDDSDDSDDGLKVTKRVITREHKNQPGDYLKIILQCLEAERNLLGLDAPKKVEASVQTLNWDAMLTELVDTPAPYAAIEAKIQQALAATPDDHPPLTELATPLSNPTQDD